MGIVSIFCGLTSAVRKLFGIPSVFGKEEIKKDKEKQVRDIGSEEGYRRVDQKLKNLEVDPFFYREQIIIFNSRCWYLLKDLELENRGFGPRNGLNLSFMITQDYENTVATIFRNIYKSFDLTVGLIKSQENYEHIRTLGTKAWLKFSAPLSSVCLLSHLQLDDQTDHSNEFCNHCLRSVGKQKSLQLLKHFLTKYPELAANMELLIQSDAFLYENSEKQPVKNHLKSLSELSIRRVLELGLDQDSLPLTLRQRMRRGPEPRRLTAKEERMVEQLQELVIRIHQQP